MLLQHLSNPSGGADIRILNFHNLRVEFPGQVADILPHATLGGQNRGRHVVVFRRADEALEHRHVDFIDHFKLKLIRRGRLQLQMVANHFQLDGGWREAGKDKRFENF